MRNLGLLSKLYLAGIIVMPAVASAQGSHPLFSAKIESGEATVTQSSMLLENGMRVSHFHIPVKKGDAVVAMIKANGGGMVQYELPATGEVLFFEEQKRNGAGGNLFYYRFDKDDTLQVAVYMYSSVYSLPFKYRYAVLSKEQLLYPVKGKFSEKLLSLLAGARFGFANWFYTVDRNIKDTTIEKGLLPNSASTWIWHNTLDHIIVQNLTKEEAAATIKKWTKQVDDALKDMPNIDIHHYSEQDMIREGNSDMLQVDNYTLNAEAFCFIGDEWKPSPTTFILMLKAEKKESGGYTVAMYIKVQ